MSLPTEVLIWVLLHFWQLVGFLIGVALFPLLAFFRPPPMFAKYIGKITAKIGAFVHGPFVVDYQPNGEYKTRAPSEVADRGDAMTDGGKRSIGPASNWLNWLGVRFGLTYAHIPDAWDSAAEELDDGEVPDVEPRDEDPPGEHRVGVAITRAKDLQKQAAGIPTFYDLRESGGLVVNLLEALSGMRDAAGLAMANRAQRYAMEEFGGDQSDYSATIVVGGIAALFAMGATLGLVVFF